MSRPTSRPYELVYGDGGFAGLPAFVSVGVGDRPWLRLWQLRDASESRLALWFRDLAARGLHPQEGRWLPRTPMPHRQAVLLARLRVADIVAWAGCWPDWLLLPRPGRPACPRAAQRPVARIFSDGRIVRYPSTRSAARAAGMTRQGLAWYLRTGRADADAAVWVELSPAPVCRDASAL